MLSFLISHSLKKSGFFEGFTDYHSHILPGVDDGVSSIEESIKILTLYEELGIKTVWLTPHIMEDIPNTTVQLRIQFEKLRSAYKGNTVIRLASENMLDNLFEERLKNRDFLPLGEKGNHLLIETSYFNPPIKLHATLEKIKASGYYPLLAHPERYNYMDEKNYRELKKTGVKLQLNLPSLAGVYGKTVRKKAEWLLKNNMYDIIGSDIHRFNFIQKMTNMSLTKNQLQRLQSIN